MILDKFFFYSKILNPSVYIQFEINKIDFPCGVRLLDPAMHVYISQVLGNAVKYK